MPNDADFTVVYDGAAIEDGTIDARQLAPTILGLADLIDETTPLATDNTANISLRVRSGFERGSFHILYEIAVQTGNGFISLFNSAEIQSFNSFLSLLGISGTLGLFQLIKKAKSRNASVVEIEHTEKVRITFDGDAPLDIDKKVWKLFTNPRARKAVEEIIRPLLHQGINQFKIRRKGQNTLEVNSDEAKHFIAPSTHENEHINRINQRVVVQSPSFKEGNKWKVFNGANSIFVTILDRTFNAKVQSGSEAFRKGDILEVKLETRQWVEGNELKAEHNILEVYSHESKIQGELL
ncbi:MAG: hypothetical protein B9S32_10970 [Verrucomicrobia bacterium Tous-C9LFEB]|nr:MAG: hypothetical protein B9S32_10970 [Verrucomicrobia bacterium Tous-C9LFEB]